MRPLGLCLLLLVGCVSGAYVPRARINPENCAWRVCVTSEETLTGRSYHATNDEPVPVTVVLTFETLDNLRRPEGGRVERVIPPESTVLIRLGRIGRGPTSAELSISIDLGASSTQADDHVYSVPFGGTVPRQLIQGFDGDETHTGSMRYSLDIAMPPKTPVLAAREGVVLYIHDGFTEGRADQAFLERANLVVVAHRDGSMASYGHLAPGIEVEVGDTVTVGELLGWSGQTGFAGQPHLHFHVGVRMLGESGRTIPIRLSDGNGMPVDLAEGVMIQPARWGQ